MHILFCHTNFPGQFGPFGAWLARQGWQVTFATARADAEPPAGTSLFRFAQGAPATATHRHARPLDQALHTAESFAVAARQAREAGILPEIVVAHSGWGAGTYARAVWPDAAFVPYVEWWYRYPRVDVLPDERPPSDPTAVAARALARNAPMLLDLAEADAAICPTNFQAAQFPRHLRARLTVQHDGVDTALLAPDANARARLSGRLGLPLTAEILTYATRGMEPYRGFPEFLRAVAMLQRDRPALHTVIAGADRVAYGEALPAGESWKTRMLAELSLDHSRLHFTGLLPGEAYRTLLQGSDVHVYLTIPFVLSWSMIEAMSVACHLVVSDVAPVREALGGAAAARCVNHHDPASLAAGIATALDDPAKGAPLREAARRRAVSGYDRSWLWPAKAEFLRHVRA